VSSVSRTDQNNNTYQLNKLQITLEEAKTLGLSLLGLSETHHFKFPANVREFSSESEDSSVGGASLVILDETITVLPQNVIKGYNFILAPLTKNGTQFHVLVVYLHPDSEKAKQTIKETTKFSSLHNLIVLGDMNCVASNAPINSSSNRKDSFRTKFNKWCDNLSIVDTIYYHYSPTQLDSTLELVVPVQAELIRFSLPRTLPGELEPTRPSLLFLITTRSLSNSRITPSTQTL